MGGPGLPQETEATEESPESASGDGVCIGRHDPPIQRVREMLLNAFTRKDLRDFCWDRQAFRALVAKFGPQATLDKMVGELLKYCYTRVLWDDLLSGLRESRPLWYERYF